MAVPKRKQSKSRVRSRKRSHKITLPAARPCPHCSKPQLPHRACGACGYYRGRQVMAAAAK
ncbi:MAG: 50S ribosomal protein L32 [Lentisphaerae bacterium]|nr:50S ribosomal protein L32 [Lentisphaerota bacterium]